MRRLLTILAAMLGLSEPPPVQRVGKWRFS
jgi:hypothetical protein